MGSFSLVSWLIVAAIGAVLWSIIINNGSGSGKPMICRSCGSTGIPRTITRGNLLIEIILWLCFLMPGLIYSIWRHSSRFSGCRKCDSKDVIPLDSPMGKKIRADLAASAPGASGSVERTSN